MLIIPLSGKISKRNPPLLTIGIILINVFVFFVLQGPDNWKYQQAVTYYFESGLAEIEIARYIEYVKPKNADGDNPDVKKQKNLDEKTINKWYPLMMQDDNFILELRHDYIITPGEEIYAKWTSLREEYEKLLSKVVFIKYGLIPASLSFVDLFTSMFLHGSIMHLVGNMVFLWLAGCILELGCGRVKYLSIYLLTGLFGGLLFALVYSKSTAPCIGASGAVSGLMGAYAVLYGRTKIKVFYSLGFYFNYTKVSGFILLPVWVGNEVFQLFFGSYTHVAYVDHIGGLVSGAVLARLTYRFFGLENVDAFEEDPKEKISQRMEEALHRVSQLDMAAARPIVEEVLTVEPDNGEALRLLFNIDKLDPENDQFHKTASRLLAHLTHKNEGERLHEIYGEYRRLSNRPRFTPDALCGISFVLSEHGYVEKAEQIMASLVQKQPNHPKIPPVLLKLGREYLKKGMADKGRQCLRILCQKYPGTSEAKIAQDLMKHSNPQ